MHKPLVKFIKTDPYAKLPKYAHESDVGADLYSIDYIEHMRAHEVYIVDTGLTLAYCDPEYEIQIRSRSGLATRGTQVVNSPGTIDPGYRGPIKVILQTSSQAARIDVGDRIAQLVVCPRYKADFSFTEELSSSDRGAGGLGSTGR